MILSETQQPSKKQLSLGAVKGIGYLADHPNVADHIASMGYKALSERDVLALVEAAIAKPFRNSSTAQIVTGISHSGWKHSPWAKDARFERLKPFISSGSDSARVVAETMINLKSQLVGVRSLARAVDLVLAGLKHKLANMFSIAEDEIDTAAPLSRYGVDSLIAAELRNWLSNSIDAQVSIFDVTQSASLLMLAREVVSRRKI